jgi:short subunit dehydrogenase-like uncharacterized protein
VDHHERRRASRASSPRDYDVLLYGAGGFTGRQTVAYFAAHAPADLRWAIAGPRRATLEAARAAAAAPLADRDLIVAPSQDHAAVDAIVSRTRVVLSTAGPFALYGTPIVDACVRFGTDYVDITGETPWMREIADRYHEAAAASGARIVPACGFDSIPSDIGAWLMARHLRETPHDAAVEVRSYFQFAAGLNGGTVASLLNMLKAPRPSQPAAAKPREGRIRMITTPRYDEALGTWIGPFVMAPTNTHVVRRSVWLSGEAAPPYGPGFVYQEAMKYDPPLARVRATAAAAGLGALFAALKQPLTRPLVTSLLPKPGEGPSIERMNRGWFTCDLIGIAADGRKARGLIRYDGDPGNRATTVFVCESALTLAQASDALPATGGVLTPATALGQPLVDRLRAAGVVIGLPRA